MVALSETASLQRAARKVPAETDAEYRLYWRFRPTRPWSREEFSCRDEAFDRYFYLLSRGLELRWGSV